MRFPEVSKKTLNKPFYFNLIKTTFNKPTDSETFKKYFKEGKEVVCFPSYDPGTRLIVPCPTSNKTDYNNIATFVKTASNDQLDAVWKEYSKEITKLLKKSNKKYWINTHGKGVAWLHLRIDDSPKHYNNWF